jgi:hypothetical protein
MFTDRDYGIFVRAGTILPILRVNQDQFDNEIERSELDTPLIDVK